MIHVLILEDDRASMEALEKILMEYPENICVHAASSYEEAKALLAQDIRYGLFLLDVNLGGENREDIGGILFARTGQGGGQEGSWTGEAGRTALDNGEARWGELSGQV